MFCQFLKKIAIGILLMPLSVYAADLVVKAKSAYHDGKPDFSAVAELNGKYYRCVIGRNGATTSKSEGDGKTPIGTFPLRVVYYRPDKFPQGIVTRLVQKPLSPNLGWCDDPTSKLYNRSFKLSIAAHAPFEKEGSEAGDFIFSNPPTAQTTSKDPLFQRERALAKLPNCIHHETLWRTDNIYDLIVVVGYNDRPVRKKRGSAIFIHIARDHFSPTAGCVAFSKTDLLDILRQLDKDSHLIVMLC